MGILKEEVRVLVSGIFEGDIDTPWFIWDTDYDDHVSFHVGFSVTSDKLAHYNEFLAWLYGVGGKTSGLHRGNNEDPISFLMDFDVPKTFIRDKTSLERAQIKFLTLDKDEQRALAEYIKSPDFVLAEDANPFKGFKRRI